MPAHRHAQAKGRHSLAVHDEWPLHSCGCRCCRPAVHAPAFLLCLLPLRWFPQRLLLLLLLRLLLLMLLPLLLLLLMMTMLLPLLVLWCCGQPIAAGQVCRCYLHG